MENQRLFFNLLTFEWPLPVVSTTAGGISCLMGGLAGGEDGGELLQLSLQKENPAGISRYYCRRLISFFTGLPGVLITAGGAGHEVQVWMEQGQHQDPECRLYNLFTLKVQIARVSVFPELMVAYDGQMRVSPKSLAELIQSLDTGLLNQVLSEGKIFDWHQYKTRDLWDANHCFPVLNNALMAALGYAAPEKDLHKNYRRYLMAIQAFYDDFLDNEPFRQVIPLHHDGFLKACHSKIAFVSRESHHLLFGNHTTASLPDQYPVDLKPYKRSPHSNIQLFYIYHHEDFEKIKEIHSHLVNGYGLYQGILPHTGLLVNARHDLNIVFSIRDNPLPEIISLLVDRCFDPQLKYLAVYIMATAKAEEKIKREQICYQVKERLFKYRIPCQGIDLSYLKPECSSWQQRLQTIAMTILTKLNGIPWQVSSPENNDLVIGIGISIPRGDFYYTASLLGFSSSGKHYSFNFLLNNRLNLLTGSIINAVKHHITAKGQLSRLIIHLNHPTPNQVVHAALETLEQQLNIPVFVVSFCKTNAVKIIAFDHNCVHHIPCTGTYLSIGDNRYLLYVNARYPPYPFQEENSHFFPLQLSLYSTCQSKLSDPGLVREIIEQVYRFSMMNWEIAKKHPLPISVRYPQLALHSATHFSEETLPVNTGNIHWMEG